MDIGYAYQPVVSGPNRPHPTCEMSKGYSVIDWWNLPSYLH